MEPHPQDLLSAFLDHYSSKIILGTMKQPMGIREISKEFGIPLSVCYRRVKNLLEMGILIEKKNGKRTKYISKIDNFNAVLNFEKNEMFITLNADGKTYDLEGKIVEG